MGWVTGRDTRRFERGRDHKQEVDEEVRPGRRTHQPQRRGREKGEERRDEKIDRAAPRAPLYAPSDSRRSLRHRLTRPAELQPQLGQQLRTADDQVGGPDMLEKEVVLCIREVESGGGDEEVERGPEVRERVGREGEKRRKGERGRGWSRPTSWPAMREDWRGAERRTVVHGAAPSCGMWQMRSSTGRSL